jgi:ferrous iron transport protein A
MSLLPTSARFARHFDEPAELGEDSIANLVPGQRARVVSIGGGGAIRQRLLDMGLMRRAIVEVQRVAPSGDPIWIRLDGYQLSLRRREAASVKVAAE